MLSALLFDLDGTIAHTDPLHRQTWQTVLAPYGIAVDEAFYRRYISGRLNPDIVRDVLPQLSLADGLALAEAKETQFRALSAQLAPMPGLQQTLAWGRARGLKQAVVSNAPGDNAHCLLDALALAAAFSTVVLAEETSAGKPEPAPYQLALERLATAPAAAVAFEDSTTGIRSAVAAGIATVGIASTHNPHDLRQAGASLVVSDFCDPQLDRWLRACVERASPRLG